MRCATAGVLLAAAWLGTRTEAALAVDVLRSAVRMPARGRRLRMPGHRAPARYSDALASTIS